MLGFGVLVHIAHILGPFGRLFGPFLGPIVELKGSRGLFDTAKSSRTCSVATISLRLGVSPGFAGYFGRKMATFGPKLRRFGRAPPDLAPPPRAATGEFLAQNLDLARPLPRLQDGYMGKRSKALGRSNGQNGMERCLLLLVACCCLLNLWALWALLLCHPLPLTKKDRGRRDLLAKKTKVGASYPPTSLAPHPTPTLRGGNDGPLSNSLIQNADLVLFGQATVCTRGSRDTLGITVGTYAGKTVYKCIKQQSRSMQLIRQDPGVRV